MTHQHPTERALSPSHGPAAPSGPLASPGGLNAPEADAQPSDDRAALRDRIAQAIHDDLTAHRGRLDQGLLGIVPRLTDAVLAVLPDHTAVRAAALNEGANAVARATGSQLDTNVKLLRRLATEPQPAAARTDDTTGASS